MIRLSLGKKQPKNTFQSQVVPTTGGFACAPWLQQHSISTFFLGHPVHKNDYYRVRPSRIKRPQVMSMVKLCPIAINFGYDFALLVHFLGHPVYAWLSFMARRPPLITKTPAFYYSSHPLQELSVQHSHRQEACCCFCRNYYLPIVNYRI